MAKYSEIKLLPFDVILAATQGDTSALRKVTEHYDSYIAKLCMRSYRGKNGDYSKISVQSAFVMHPAFLFQKAERSENLKCDTLCVFV